MNLAEKKIFTLLLLICSGVCYGQQFDPLTDTVQWKITSLKDLQTDTTQTHLSKLITYGTSKIEWIQHEGEEQETVMTFAPDSTSGNWNGTGNFSVYCSKRGSLRIFKFYQAGGNGKVNVIFRKPEEEERSLEFTISEIKNLTHP